MKPARLVSEMNVAFSAEAAEAIAIACDWQGLRPAQFVRQATIEKLTAMKLIEHPLAKRAAAAATNGEAKSA